MSFREEIKCEPKTTEEEYKVLGYIEYVNSQGENFLNYLEMLNECIKIAEMYELIGPVEIKARIKDFDSSNRNTEKKALDDVFGIEVIPTTERDKEWIMLLTELIFKIEKSIGFNKTDNGYKAYNQMLELKSKEDDFNFDNIKTIIENAKIKQRNSSDPNDISEVFKYPNLKKRIEEGKSVEFSDLEKMAMLEITKRVKKFADEIECNKTDIYMPIIEMQIKTKEAADNAIRGDARHIGYKLNKGTKFSKEDLEKRIKEYEDRIKSLYEIGYIKRGINAPIKFERINGKIQMQRFERTLVEIYPFLRERIVKDRLELGMKKTREYNKQAAELLTIYPFLKSYISVKEEFLTEEIRMKKIMEMINTNIYDEDCSTIAKRRKII